MDQKFNDFDIRDWKFKDVKLGMMFETRDMLDDTLALLRFNCPEPTCDDVCSGWGDLRRHVKREHNRMLWYVRLVLPTKSPKLIHAVVVRW